MTVEVWLLGAAGIAGLAAVWIATRAVLRRRSRTDEWLAGELRGQRLAYAEKTFRSSGNVQVVARVDRAYRGRDGVITLVELKTRSTHRVHPSDIIELSAQRSALAAETGEPVSRIGWVVVQSEARRTAHRVHLLPQDAVQGLVLQREALLAGSMPPAYPTTRALCASCAYRRRCYPPRPGQG